MSSRPVRAATALLTLLWLTAAARPESAGVRASTDDVWRGWFYAADNEAHVLYVTEVQEIDLANKWQEPNYVAGFRKARHWEKRTTSQLFLQLLFISKNPRFGAMDLAKRERIIKSNTDRGYKIVVIPMPTPAPVVIKAQAGRPG